jgi:precorrin-6A/cobalt-precorrin-6A reductase
MEGKIAVFGGTAEGRTLAWKLAERRQVQAFVATSEGRELLEREKPTGLLIREGRLTREEMEAVFAREGFAAVVDATHPYAQEVSANIRSACAAAGIPCLRLVREETPLPPGCLTAATPEEAAVLCAGLSGNILLATGAKELPAFCQVPGVRERLYPRVLPVEESLAACRRAGIPFSRIVALQGPFSLDLNLALMEQFQIRVLVTKDGGKAGGTAEKLEAARRLGAIVVMIRRPPEEEGHTFQEILKRLTEEGEEEES